MPRKKAEKRYSYKKDFAQKFYSLSSQGAFPIQIATILGVLLEHLQRWATDPRKPEFGHAWKEGKEACEAYHIHTLNEMIKNGASGPVIDAQKYILRVRFKEGWAEKQESKVEISETEKLTDKEIHAKIARHLLKPSTRDLIKQLADEKRLILVPKDGTNDK